MKYARALGSYLRQPVTWLVLYLVGAVVSSLLKYFGQPYNLGGGEQLYTHYNNFVIFRQAFWHLLAGQDLYLLYPTEHWDYYKYSPAFALLFAPFAVLPAWLGLILWNLMNAGVLAWGVLRLQLQNRTLLAWMLAFSFFEMLTSVQNAQSNALIAGLFLHAMADLQLRRPGRAALWLSLTVFTKLFGLVAFALVLLYPSRWRASAWAVLWFVLLAFLPLPFIGWESLLAQYKSWAGLLRWDLDGSTGISMLGWLETWFGYTGPKTWVTLAGVLLFLLPLIRYKAWSEHLYRHLVLANVLLWVVLFNHKAESPTFVLATVGVGLWYFLTKPNRFYIILMVLVLLLTQLSSTDLFPPYVRQHILSPYVGKVVPCILVWLVLTWQLVTGRYREREGAFR